MRDYTTNNYCDFLWISDLLALKKDSRNTFSTVFRKNNKTITVNIGNVAIFGTIVEVKQIASKGFIYHVDDGTGVIVCKHSQEQFEEVLSVIESEHQDVLNETLQFRQNLEQTLMTDTSTDEALFSERSVQLDEADINRKSNLMGLQSICDDLFNDFSILTQEHSIGDSVFIQGKLYNYFSTNQVYINTIRPMNFQEEIIRTSIKLEEEFDTRAPEKRPNPESRLSGLMTFDTITHLNPKFSKPVHIETPDTKDNCMSESVVTPHLDSTITFDTFAQKR